MGKAELRIEIDEGLLEKAKAAGVPVEQVVEDALKAAVSESSIRPGFLAASAARQKADPAAAEARAKKWAEENADAIKAYNERVERESCFGDEWRNW